MCVCVCERERECVCLSVRKRAKRNKEESKQTDQLITKGAEGVASEIEIGHRTLRQNSAVQGKIVEVPASGIVLEGRADSTEIGERSIGDGWPANQSSTAAGGDKEEADPAEARASQTAGLERRGL